jgi:hypothetical protein
MDREAQGPELRGQGLARAFGWVDDDDDLTVVADVPFRH